MNFFSSIGRAQSGLYVTVPQLIFYSLRLLYPHMGIKGLIYTAPVADFIFVVGITLITTEMRKMRKLEQAKEERH